MTWHTARAASKRPLPKPRHDHGLVTTFESMSAEQLRNVLVACNDRACPACGYVRCDTKFHSTDLPDGWMNTPVPRHMHKPVWGLVLHPKTTGVVWCVARGQWAYQFVWDTSKGPNGMASEREIAMLEVELWHYTRQREREMERAAAEVRQRLTRLNEPLELADHALRVFGGGAGRCDSGSNTAPGSTLAYHEFVALDGTRIRMAAGSGGGGNGANR